MKTLSAAFTALAVLGFAGAAAAQCASYSKPPVDQTAQTPVVIPPSTVAVGA